MSYNPSVSKANSSLYTREPWCRAKRCMIAGWFIRWEERLPVSRSRLPPGGSSRWNRVRESAELYIWHNDIVPHTPSVTLRAPPSSRRKALGTDVQLADGEKHFVHTNRIPMALGSAVMKTSLCTRFMSERSLLASDLSPKPHFRRQPAGEDSKGEPCRRATVPLWRG